MHQKSGAICYRGFLLGSTLIGGSIKGSGLSVFAGGDDMVFVHSGGFEGSVIPVGNDRCNSY